MGIKRLIIKNCLGIEELTLNPKKVTVITGGNEVGKTSILETIEKILFNTKRRAKFVRMGSEKAYIELDTEDGIKICRTVKEDEAGLDMGSVKVTRDGQPISSPETYLKKLFATTNKNRQDIFCFNPVDFIQKRDTEQTDILLSLMPITVTESDSLVWFGEAPKVNYEKHGLQVLKALEEWFYDARREANSRVKAVSDECVAVAKRLPDNYVVAEWESVNLGAMFAELTNANQFNQDLQFNGQTVEAYKTRLEAINNKYTLQEKEAQEEGDRKTTEATDSVEEQKNGLQKQIDEINVRIGELIKNRDRIQTTLNNIDQISLSSKIEAITTVTNEKFKNIAANREGEINELDEQKTKAETFLKDNSPVDIAPIKGKCDESERMKAYIPLAKEVEGLETRLKAEEDIAQRYDECVTATRKKPHELLAEVELPVKGLGIDDKGSVTINGLPLSNLSTAQQIKACLDIARALAQNTALKLINIDKVEHLDEDVRAEFLKQIEADLDYQYFVTIVTDGELKIESK